MLLCKRVSFCGVSEGFQRRCNARWQGMLLSDIPMTLFGKQ